MYCTTKLYGRIGNQMFQIANCIAYSLKHNLKYSIPTQTLNNLFPIYFSHFQKNDFKLENIYLQKEYEYKEIPYLKNVLLDGYFQSELFFKEFKTEVIKEFNFTYPEKNKKVSIHIRRGDYLNLQDKHSIVTNRYIENCIDFFNNIGYYEFIVFSDDIQWCKSNVSSGKYKGNNFIYSENNSEITDLLLMSSCEHNIISNSSFSWWGAYLNGNENKMVLYPDVWFGYNLNLNTKDLIPDKWIKIQC